MSTVSFLLKQPSSVHNGNRLNQKPKWKRFPYHFFWANQRKADIKIFPWIQCEINKDRQILWATTRELHLITWNTYLPPAFRRNGEGTVFTGVCLFTLGIPSPSHNTSMHWSHVLSGWYPSGWSHVLFWDTPIQSPMGDTLSSPVGYSPSREWMGMPPSPGRQSSRAGTCCTAVGMPLAFTQEDFLVDS